MTREKKIPEAVAEKISITTGVDITAITRTARTTRCSKCSAPVIRGLDDDRCAFNICVDPQPLTPLGEAVAVTAGLGSWERHPYGGRIVIDSRDHYARQARPAASTPRYDVHARHQCGRTWPYPATRAPTALTPAQHITPTAPPY